MKNKSRLIKTLYILISFFFAATLLIGIINRLFLYKNYSDSAIIDLFFLAARIFEFSFYTISLLLFFRKNKYLIFFNTGVLFSILILIFDFFFKIYYQEIFKEKDLVENLGYTFGYLGTIVFFIYIVYLINKNESKIKNNEIDEIGAY